MSPCILVAVTNNNRILLVKHNNEIRTLSTVIAGFVELGESLEECVKREVQEEVGLQVTNIKYLESQSWPFPNQLMMAFSAEAISDEIEIDNNEILEANWFQKDDLPHIPPEPSLSNKLIKTTLDLCSRVVLCSSDSFFLTGSILLPILSSTGFGVGSGANFTLPLFGWLVFLKQAP